MKRFAVFLKSESPFQVQALKARLAVQGFWHWTPSAWIIMDSTNTFTADSVRDMLRETHPNVHSLVIEIPSSGPWAGFGPVSGPNDMFAWMHSEWKKP